MDNRDEKAFVCVSKEFEVFMGYTKVKEAFPHIPCERDSYERIAYASGFDDSDVAKMREALAGHWGALRAVDSFFSNSLVKEIGSITCFEERELRVVEIFHSLWGSELKCKLEEASVQYVDRWWKGMEGVSKHGLQKRKSEFLDRMLEGRYALALQRGGFDVQMDPYGGVGPDLQIRYENIPLDIEVSRFQRNEGFERKLEGLGRLEEICSEASMLGKIKDESKQLCEDKNSIVLLNSDNIGIDWVELRQFSDQFSCKDAPDPCLNPPKLCAVILCSSLDPLPPEVFFNPHARMPADELERILEKIMRCLG